MLLYISKCLYVYLHVITYVYIHIYAYIKKMTQLFLLLKYSNLTVRKRSLFKHSYKAAQTRQGQAVCHGKNRGALWRQSVSEFGQITKSSILCFICHAHTAKPRVYVMLAAAVGGPLYLCHCLGPSLSFLAACCGCGSCQHCHSGIHTSCMVQPNPKLGFQSGERAEWIRKARARQGSQCS